MKAIRLACIRIWGHFKGNKIIFLLYFLGSIFCTVMFIYLYGNLVSAVAVRNDEQLGLRSYQLDFYHSKNLAEGDLDFLLDYQPEIRVSTLLPEEVQKEYYSTTNRIDQSYPLYLSANWTDNTIPPSQGRTEFTEEEEAGYAVVLPSEVLPNGFHAPSEITLWGQSFTAIGAHSLMGELIIPRPLYQKLNLGTSRVYLVVPNRLTPQEEEGFYAAITAEFPDVTISNYGIQQSADARYLEDVLTVSALYLLCIFVFSFLIKFMVDRNRRENTIYSLVGAGKRRVTGILLMETGGLALLTGILGLALHFCFYESFFEKLNISENIQYSLRDYAVVLILTVGLSLLCIVPFILKFAKRTSIEAYRLH